MDQLLEKRSVAIGGDHAGHALKNAVIRFLEKEGHKVEDCGSYSPDPIDFPDIAQLISRRVLEGRAQRGILVCGTGVGACIAANKIPGIRAAVCHDIYSSHQCVEHDDVNVACIGAQVVGASVTEECLRAFLSAEFSNEDHFRRRVAKLADLERAER